MNYRKKTQRGQSVNASNEEPDPYKKLYGTTIPKNIPERSLSLFLFANSPLSLLLGLRLRPSSWSVAIKNDNKQCLVERAEQRFVCNNGRA